MVTQNVFNLSYKLFFNGKCHIVQCMHFHYCQLLSEPQPTQPRRLPPAPISQSCMGNSAPASTVGSKTVDRNGPDTGTCISAKASSPSGNKKQNAQQAFYLWLVLPLQESFHLLKAHAACIVEKTARRVNLQVVIVTQGNSTPLSCLLQYQ